MFTNILFLILVLLLINFAPSNEESISWMFSPWTAALIALCLYGIILLVIYLQNRLFANLVRRNKSRMLIVVQLELLAFLVCYQFFLGTYRIFLNQPFQVFPLLFALILYFIGLLVFYFTFPGKRSYADLQVIAPFALPFILLVFLFDLIQFVPSKDFQNLFSENNPSIYVTIAIYGFIILLLIALMIFMPHWIQKIWQCKPLTDPELKTRLELICKKANFRHAGFKIWTVLNDSLTAAIVGIVPRWRYILFTRRLLNELSPDSVEAILVHEIGHNYHRHLLIYPFIILGMSVIVGWISWLVIPYIGMLAVWGNGMYPSFIWNWIYPLLLFLIYALTIAIYFRVVFGLFSRLFERQADLHVFALGVSPLHLINALDYIGIATGNTHDIPNWHHFGIRQRIDFLKAAMQNKSIIEEHNKKVRRYVFTYFVLLIIFSIGLFLI